MFSSILAAALLAAAAPATVDKPADEAAKVQHVFDGYWYCNASTTPYGETNYMSSIFYAETSITNAISNDYYSFVRNNWTSSGISVICQGPFDTYEDASYQFNDDVYDTEVRYGNSVVYTNWTW